MNNPLYDYDFLNALTQYRQREILARITLLTWDELPIESIEGRVTGGSINVDGTSALRRTCNLTMILKDQNEINKFEWAVKQKIKVEIGIKNVINTAYPDIIWFKQGIYILTTCNSSHSTNNYTVSINGKDKMCLLNGDISGAFPTSIDLGQEEYYDKENDIITKTALPLKTIIREVMQNYGNELAANVIINDLDDMGLELLEYRNEEQPLYLIYDIEHNYIDQITMQGDLKVIPVDGETTIALKDIPIYAQISNLVDPQETPTEVYYGEGEDRVRCNIIKLKYGDLAGYRLTDLTYAGDLIANVGESVVSILDKIKNMLGEFEYFYNLDGKFIFQKKRNYISTPWNSVEADNEDFLTEMTGDVYPLINLTDGRLITSFSNNPNLANVKNDFTVWGTKTSISGAEMPIHMRFAIDKKPTSYWPIREMSKDNTVKFYNDNGFLDMITETVNGKEEEHYYFNKPITTNAENAKNMDWRELIYQMALDYRRHYHDDDFLSDVAAKNPQYPTGRTGYEQYYTDLEGFWRELYNPDPEPIYEPQEEGATLTESSCISASYRLMTEQERTAVLTELNKIPNDRGELLQPIDNIYVIDTNNIIDANGMPGEKNVIYPFVGSSDCCLHSESTYGYFKEDEWVTTSDVNVLNEKPLEALYGYFKDENGQTVEGVKSPIIDERYKEALKTNNKKLYVPAENVLFTDLDEDLLSVYADTMKIEDKEQYVCKPSITRWKIADNFGNKSEDKEQKELIDHLTVIPSGDYYGDMTTVVEEAVSFMRTANKAQDEQEDQSHKSYWLKDVYENPGALLFWFDFLDASESELAKYSVGTIGIRTKAVNDTAVKSIYYRDIPSVIFTSDIDGSQPGYTSIQLPQAYEGLFSISGRGKSAKESIDALLNQHSYCVESATISCVPIYHLEPNTRISIRDDKSNINGEYNITKLTIPLAYNGTMSLTATKVISNII